MSDVFIDEIVCLTTKGTMPTELSKAVVVLMNMGGAVANADPENFKTCVPKSVRNARFFAILEIHWKKETGEKGKNVAKEWCKRVVDVLKKYKTASTYSPDEIHTSNEYGESNSTGQFSSVEDSALFQKLSDLKLKYDPENFFKQNLNIKPTAVNK